MYMYIWFPLIVTWTLNHSLYTRTQCAQRGAHELNLQPYTLDTKHWTPDNVKASKSSRHDIQPKPYTLHPTPYILNPKP